MKAAITIISLMVVVTVSLESVFHYREQWKNYRSTEQLLGHEQFEFLANVGVYKGSTEEAAFQLFVERVEDAISSENAATLNVMTVGSESVTGGSNDRRAADVSDPRLGSFCRAFVECPEFFCFEFQGARYVQALEGAYHDFG